MPSNHLILCHPLLLLPSIIANIRVFSNELALNLRWPKYWSFSYQFCRSVVSESLQPHESLSTPAIPVHHQLLEFTQIQVH